MRVKSITLYGFKSFAEKTVIDVSSDINAVVGPNGCGKSNVVEAVLWVLGEQSARQLRGSKMDDVIFSGSKGRKPAQFAEVSLLFDNSDGYLPIEYREVAVSRKLFRNGDSEYSINRSTVRLKDIHELFSSSGLSKQSFAIIGQGKVDEFIRHSPQARRHMIDEVSGVSKFFAKRAEATKKLEASQIHVDRVRDRVCEIEQQEKKLKAQMEAARTWAAHKEELAAYEKKRLELRYAKARLDVSEIEKEYNSIDEGLAHVKCEAAEREREKALSEEEVRVIENKVQRIKEKEYKAQLNRTLYEKEKQRMEELIQKLSQRKGEIETHLREGNERNKKSLEDIATLLGESEQEEREAEKLESDIKKEEAYLSSLSQELEAKAHPYDEKRKEHSHIQASFASLQVEEKYLKKRLQEKQDSLLHLKKSIKNIEHTLSQLHGEDSHNKKQEIESAKKEIDSKKDELTALTEALQKQESQSKIAEERVMRISSEYETVRAKKEAIEAMKSTLYGVDEKLKDLLAKLGCIPDKKIAKARASSDIPHVSARLLSEVVRDELEKQPEAVLSFFDAVYGSTVVVQTLDECCTLFEYAEKHQIRGLSCIVLEMLSSKRKKKEVDISPHVLFQALLKNINLEAINDTESSFRDLLKKRFSHAKVAESPISHYIDNRWHIDSLGVIRLSPYSESSMGKASASGRFSGEKELSRLNGMLEEISKKLSSEKNDLQQLKKEAHAISIQKAEVNEAMRKLDMNLVHMTFQWNQAELKRKELQSVLSSKKKQMVELEREAQEVELRLKDVAERKNSWTLRLQEIEKELLGYEQAIQEAKEAVKKRQLQLDLLKRSLHQKNLRLQEIEKKRLKASTLEEEWKMQEKRLVREVHEVEQEIGQRKREVEAVELQLTESSQHEKLSTQELIAISAEYEAKKKALADAIKSIHALEKKKKQIEDRAKSCFEKLSQKRAILDVTLKELQEISQDTIFTGDEIQIDGSIGEINVLLEQIARDIRAKSEWLEAHKDINFHAEAEYREIEERLHGLQKQLIDLESTRQSILTLIDDLEAKSRLEFMSAFDAVRNRFRENFITLFDGGEADLVLIGAESISDAGIELTASPPGKEMRSLNLLSGGERCLTALALLFALFQVKKAPLCLLDEVDAPLDEANVIRFHRLLAQSSKDTQCVVVTHNKRTMASSDKLIGVSMREKGVSCVLSVQLANA